MTTTNKSLTTRITVAVANSPWTPASLTNSIYWDARQGITLDTNNFVTSWIDQGANHIILANSVANAAKFVANGINGIFPAVQFSNTAFGGGNSGLQNTAVTLAANNIWSIWIISANSTQVTGSAPTVTPTAFSVSAPPGTNTSAANSFFYGIGQGVAAGNTAFQFYSSGYYTAFEGGNTANTTQSSTLPVLSAFIQNAATSRFWYNGFLFANTSGTASIGGAGGTNRIILGAGISTTLQFAYNGTIAAAGITQGYALTANDMANLMSWAATSFGLQGANSLPNTSTFGSGATTPGAYWGTGFEKTTNIPRKQVVDAAWDPQNLPGLQAFWRADRGITTVSASNTSVLQWNDSSPAGQHLVNAIAAQMPTWSPTGFNGFPGLQFANNIANNYLVNSSFQFQNTAMSYFILCNGSAVVNATHDATITSLIPSGFVNDFGAGNPGLLVDMGQNGANSAYAYLSNNTLLGGATTNLPNNQPLLLTFTIGGPANANVYNTYLNQFNTFSSTWPYPVGNNSNIIRIGTTETSGSDALAPFLGNVAFIGMCQGYVMTTQDIQNLMAWSNKNWGTTFAQSAPIITGKANNFIQRTTNVTRLSQLLTQTTSSNAFNMFTDLTGTSSASGGQLCVRQLLDSTHLGAGGGGSNIQITMTWSAVNLGVTPIDRTYIGRQLSSGSHAFDGNQVQVTWNGGQASPGTTFSGNVVSDVITLPQTWNPSANYIFAYDINQNYNVTANSTAGDLGSLGFWFTATYTSGNFANNNDFAATPTSAFPFITMISGIQTVVSGRQVSALFGPTTTNFIRKNTVTTNYQPAKLITVSRANVKGTVTAVHKIIYSQLQSFLSALVAETSFITKLVSKPGMLSAATVGALKFPLTANWHRLTTVGKSAAINKMVQPIKSALVSTLQGPTPYSIMSGIGNNGSSLDFTSGVQYANGTITDVPIGSLVYIWGFDVSGSNTATLTAFSDTSGQTWTRVTPGASVNNGSVTPLVAWTITTSDMPIGTKFTATTSDTLDYFVAGAFAVQGVASKDIQFAGSSGVGGNSISQASGLLANTSEMLIYSAYYVNGDVGYSNKGWTNWDTGGNPSHWITDYQLVASTASTGLTPRWTSATPYAYMLLSFVLNVPTVGYAGILKSVTAIRIFNATAGLLTGSAPRTLIRLASATATLTIPPKLISWFRNETVTTSVKMVRSFTQSVLKATVNATHQIVKLVSKPGMLSTVTATLAKIAVKGLPRGFTVYAQVANTTWTPAQLTGCVGFWSAANGVVNTTSGAVTQWLDQSSSGQHLANGSTANGGIIWSANAFNNNFPGLICSNIQTTQDYLVNTSFNFTNNIFSVWALWANSTVAAIHTTNNPGLFALGTPNDNVANGMVFIAGANGTSGNTAAAVYDGAAAAAYFGFPDTYPQNNALPIMMGVSFDGTHSHEYYNGTANATINSPVSTQYGGAGARFQVGARFFSGAVQFGAAFSFAGTIAAIGICKNYSMTAADWQNMMTWASTTYGVNLPNSSLAAGTPTGIQKIVQPIRNGLGTVLSLITKAVAVPNLVGSFLATATGRYGPTVIGSIRNAVATVQTQIQKGMQQLSSPTAYVVAGTTWDPTLLPNLMGFWRADKGITVSAGNVTRWTDQGPLGQTLANTGLATIAPAFITDASGHPGIAFSGVNEGLTNTAFKFGSTKVASFWVVANNGTANISVLNATALQENAGGDQNTLPGFRMTLGERSNTSWAVNGTAAAWAAGLNTTQPVTTPIVAGYVFDGVNSTLWINGLAVNSVAFSTNVGINTSTDFYIGQAANTSARINQGFSGTIYAAAIANGYAMTANDWNNVVGWSNYTFGTAFAATPFPYASSSYTQLQKMVAPLSWSVFPATATAIHGAFTVTKAALIQVVGATFNLFKALTPGRTNVKGTVTTQAFIRKIYNQPTKFFPMLATVSMTRGFTQSVLAAIVATTAIISKGKNLTYSAIVSTASSIFKSFVTEKDTSVSTNVMVPPRTIGKVPLFIANAIATVDFPNIITVPIVFVVNALHAINKNVIQHTLTTGVNVVFSSFFEGRAFLREILAIATATASYGPSTIGKIRKATAHFVNVTMSKDMTATRASSIIAGFSNVQKDLTKTVGDFTATVAATYNSVTIRSLIAVFNTTATSLIKKAMTVTYIAHSTGTPLILFTYRRVVNATRTFAINATASQQRALSMTKALQVAMASSINKLMPKTYHMAVSVVSKINRSMLLTKASVVNATSSLGRRSIALFRQLVVTVRLFPTTHYAQTYKFAATVVGKINKQVSALRVSNVSTKFRINKQINIVWTAAVSATSTMRRRVGRSLVSTMTVTNITIKGIARSLKASAHATGAIIKSVGLPRLGHITASGRVIKSATKTFLQKLTPATSITHFRIADVKKLMTVATQTFLLPRTVGKRFISAIRLAATMPPRRITLAVKLIGVSITNSISMFKFHIFDQVVSFSLTATMSGLSAIYQAYLVPLTVTVKTIIPEVQGKMAQSVDAMSTTVQSIVAITKPKVYSVPNAISVAVKTMMDTIKAKVK